MDWNFQIYIPEYVIQHFPPTANASHRSEMCQLGRSDFSTISRTVAKPLPGPELMLHSYTFSGE